MKKGWTTTKLVAAGSLGVLIVVCKLPGSAISVVTGSLWIGGLINGLVEPAIVVICLLLLNRPGAATVMYIIIGVLELSLPLRGPAGWAVKLPILLVAGLLIDWIYSALKRKTVVAAVAVGIFFEAYIGVTILGMGYLCKIPGLYESAKVFFSPVGVLTVIAFGTLGSYLGYFVYQKIKDTAVVKRIQGV